MIAYPPDDIDKYHITVNGLWHGYIGENLSSPFALGRLVVSIFSGRAYVMSLHTFYEIFLSKNVLCN